MQMKHGLTRTGIDIEYGPISLFVNATLFGQSLRDLKHVREEGAVALFDIIQGWNVFSRNNEKVHRRLRMNVFERDHEVVLMHLLRRCFASNDSAEQTGLHLIEM